MPPSRTPELHHIAGTLSQPSGWKADIWVRMKRHLLLKAAGISAFMWLFFIGYFHLLRHPAHPVIMMPLTWLDTMIPFQPGALAAYLSLWLYVGVAPGLLLSFRELIVYGLWAAALCVAGLACFYFVPTAVPPPGFPMTRDGAFAMLQGVDAAGNACPSMHVATAMFSAIWIEHLMRHLRAWPGLRVLNVLWFVLIAYSTVAIRQHVALDVLAGAVLGVAFALPSLRWGPKSHIKPV